MVEKETLLLAGTIAGFVAALLSIMEKLLDLRERFRPVDGVESIATSLKPDSRHTSPSRRKSPAWKRINVSSYLLLQELTVIIAAGVLLNYLGLMLSIRLQSILYLDMVGTALAALLLGPWWGALTALLSSALINWALFPGPGDVLIFPWLLVNMTGGFWWGFLARRPAFRAYLKRPRASTPAHAWYLLVFGVCGAGLMSVPGIFIQAVLSEPSVLALHPEAAKTLHAFILDSQAFMQERAEAFFGIVWGDSIGWTIVSWIQTCLRYIPDKTISVAIALTIIKYGFPLFERELIQGDPPALPPRDTLAGPVILGAVYLPCFFALVMLDQYQHEGVWLLWLAPWCLIVGGIALLYRQGPADEVVHRAALARAERYAQAHRTVQREPAHDFGQRLTLVTLLACLLFVLCLPLILANFYQVAINFFCVVYGFLLAVYLIREAISQNISAVRE